MPAVVIAHGHMRIPTGTGALSYRPGARLFYVVQEVLSEHLRAAHQHLALRRIWLGWRGYDGRLQLNHILDATGGCKFTPLSRRKKRM